jgi:hypothetical protein
VASLNDLGPGWLAFGPIGGGAGGLVGVGQVLLTPWRHQLTWKRWWKVRHTGVVATRGGGDFGPDLVQAEPGGVQEVEMTTGQHWTKDWIYVLPKYGIGQADKVAEIARRQARKKIPYAFECYPAIALHRTPIPTPALDHWLSRTDTDGDPVRVICSWEVDAALTLAGGLDGNGHVFDDGRALHDVVPSELYLRLLELGPAEVLQGGPDGIGYLPSKLTPPTVGGKVRADGSPRGPGVEAPRPIPQYLL